MIQGCRINELEMVLLRKKYTMDEQMEHTFSSFCKNAKVKGSSSNVNLKIGSSFLPGGTMSAF